MWFLLMWSFQHHLSSQQLFQLTEGNKHAVKLSNKGKSNSEGRSRRSMNLFVSSRVWVSALCACASVCDHWWVVCAKWCPSVVILYTPILHNILPQPHKIVFVSSNTGNSCTSCTELRIAIKIREEENSWSNSTSLKLSENKKKTKKRKRINQKTASLGIQTHSLLHYTFSLCTGGRHQSL